MGSINFRGRFVYLEAIQEHWPALLESLRTQVLPKWQRVRSNILPTTLRELEARSEWGSAVGALQEWAQTHRITDQWIFDAAGKAGTIYVLNTNNLGKLQSGHGQVVQTLQVTPRCTCDSTNDLIFWNSSSRPTLYVWPLGDVLRAYAWVGGTLLATPVSMNNLLSNYPGGYLTGSSNGNMSGTGIIWALTGDNQTVQGGTLRAFDASNLSNQIWNSDLNSLRDAPGNFAKNVQPVVANGKVYVGNFSNQLIVYGLLKRVPVQLPTIERRARRQC